MMHAAAYHKAAFLSPHFISGLHAADGTHQFFGNRCLASLVVVQGHLLNQLACVAGRAVHGRHARPVFGCRRFQQDAIGLNLKMFRDQETQQLAILRLVHIISAALIAQHASRFVGIGVQPKGGPGRAEFRERNYFHCFRNLLRILECGIFRLRDCKLGITTVERSVLSSMLVTEG
jgi:hypothetical protein